MFLDNKYAKWHNAIIKNLKKFSEDNGIIGTKLYTTLVSGKYINGFRALGKI